MYSGSILKPLKYFDAWFGTHQKIDRVARKHVARLLTGQDQDFPTARQITRFEGLNGPDGIKRKSPGGDEPRHFYDPHDPKDTQLVGLIEEHYAMLVQALRERDRIHAAFEASWLAHALVDGLTPAHHYPYEKELVKLRGGEGIESRTTLKQQILMPGDTLPARVRNNWKMFGDKGLLSTHFAFEMGVAVMVSPLRLKLGLPTDEERTELRQQGIGQLFQARAKEIADLSLYDKFYKSGWTPALAKQIRRELIPRISNLVTLAWYGAILDAQSATGSKK